MTMTEMYAQRVEDLQKARKPVPSFEDYANEVFSGMCSVANDLRTRLAFTEDVLAQVLLLSQARKG